MQICLKETGVMPLKILRDLDNERKINVQIDLDKVMNVFFGR